MDKNLIKKIVDNQDGFVPLLFTRNQMNVMQKYLSCEKLTYNEQHILYVSIKRKLAALGIFGNKEFYITGRHKILNGRVEKAKDIIKKFEGGVFVGGSFLFKEDYNDIDVFVLKERGYKETHDGNMHIIELTERRMENPVFQSAAQISISNFPINNKVSAIPLKLNDLMSAYHESVIEVMNREKREITRNLVFNYHFLINKTILDGMELKRITEWSDLGQIESMAKALFKKKFSNNYLYVTLHEYVKSLDAAIDSEKSNKNLIRYKNLYGEIIHEARRGKAEAS